MTMKTIYKSFFAALFAISFVSCNSFLDVMPDNRAELTSDNVSKILLSAYTLTYPAKIWEYSSDNVDKYPDKYTASLTSRELYAYHSVSAQSQDTPHALWEGCYFSIAACNQALKTIEEEGNPKSLDAARGEALMSRAYHHFMLAVTFCQAYRNSTADFDMGLPYVREPETTVRPNYERGSLEELYANIEADILEALPLMSDANLSIPKYHFNVAAAYAFATRFYLNYVKPDKSNYQKVIEYANYVLGPNPSAVLRDWKSLNELSVNGDIQPNEYINVANPANLLLIASISPFGYTFAPTQSEPRINHGPTLASETFRSTGPWGTSDSYYFVPFSNSSSLPTKEFLRKQTVHFEILDPVSGTGYAHTIHVALTTDEVLLNRAEAYALTGQTDKAIEDLNTWANTISKAPKTMTKESIDAFYRGLTEHTALKPSAKHKLDPDFALGDAENLIHALLQARRITFVHEGLRWLDIKRYNIPVYRRLLSDNASKTTVLWTLNPYDDYRALQIPSDVINAGFTPNPRTMDTTFEY